VLGKKSKNQREPETADTQPPKKSLRAEASTAREQQRIAEATASHSKTSEPTPGSSSLSGGASYKIPKQTSSLPVTTRGKILKITLLYTLRIYSFIHS